MQVMGVKALGIAMKLTLSGVNQLVYPQTWIFAIIVTTFLLTQMNYLNKVTMNFLFQLLFLLFSATIFERSIFFISIVDPTEFVWTHRREFCCYIIRNTVYSLLVWLRIHKSTATFFMQLLVYSTWKLMDLFRCW